MIRQLKAIAKKTWVMLKHSDLRKLPLPPQKDSTHLRATMDWLCYAQDIPKSGGVSTQYDLWKNKWDKEYRETTGYIIETFLEYYRFTQERQYLDRAVRMGDWEISVQCEDGAVGEIQKDGSIGKKIFNTGQVMLGYNALYAETKEEKYLTASKKGAEWIIKQQAEDGGWHTHTSKNNKGGRTINARTAWPLLQLYKTTGNEAYKLSAERNLEWILRQQRPNFWFDNTSLTEENRPWTHYIAYTISGLLECYLLLGSKDEKIFQAFYGAADIILKHYEKNKWLPGSFDEDWQSKDTYTCITGNAQMAIVWMQIYKITKEKRFLDGAVRILEYVKSLQPINPSNSTLNGSLAGSYPIDGYYSPYSLINWAPKFFADALLLKAALATEVEG